MATSATELNATATGLGALATGLLASVRRSTQGTEEDIDFGSFDEEVKDIYHISVSVIYAFILKLSVTRYCSNNTYVPYKARACVLRCVYPFGVLDGSTARRENLQMVTIFYFCTWFIGFIVENP